MRLFFAPIVVSLLSIPLFLKKVPRNPLYGLRTKDTMSSNKVWYSANRAMGVGGIIGGVLWLLAAMVLPKLGMPAQYATFIGLGLLIAAAAIAVNLAD